MSIKEEDDYKQIVTPYLIFICGGGGIINNIYDSEKTYLVQALEWLNRQKSEAIKTAVEKWPNDYKFIAETAYWFEQITDAVTANPPIDNVKSLIVKENMFGTVVGVDYEYYKKDDPNIGKVGLCITTLTDNYNKSNE